MNENDLVLLEGPPGTGKTHTITSLIIHCIATGKRVLVVSDKQAAIHALNEQMHEYLFDHGLGSAENKNLEKLWRSAVKVIDEAPDAKDSLAKWVRQIRAMLDVESTKEIQWPREHKKAVNEIGEIDEQIQ